MVWHRPQRLLPPQLVAALDAAHAGDSRRALRLLGREDGTDALTADTTRLVRGLAAAESGQSEKAQRLLLPLMRTDDPDISLAATLASVEIQMERRGFARAAPWLQRAWRHAQDEPTALVLEASLFRLQMRRGGPVKAAELDRFSAALKRQHAAPVHATVQLLIAEHALYTGSLTISARAERAARSLVETSRLASLRRWHESLRGLLQDTTVALVEDWKRPRRAMRRTEIADLQEEPWQIWADSRHRKLCVAAPRGLDAETIHFAHSHAAWLTLQALLEAPAQRLSWKALQGALDLAGRSEAQERLGQLQHHLGKQAGIVREGTTGCGLAVQRIIHLLPTPDLPAHHQQLLALLAERPGTAGQELAGALHAPLRTVQRHLQLLRQVGLALIVGGGRDARYWAI